MKAFFAMGRSRYDPEQGKERWLHINNFGYYCDITKDLAVARPRGRRDYHLLYVADGEISVCGKELRSGDFYLFYPGEPQNYIYKKKEGCRYYWSHFTGSRVPELLSEIGLCSGFHPGNNRKREANSLLHLLTEALSHPGEQHSAYPLAVFFSFLQFLSAPPVKPFPFSRAASALENTERKVLVSDLAALYHMSPGHFIRSFKQAYGVTPANYRILCQLRQAKNLLCDTEMPIGYIAEQCGFSDPLYFSRLFRKHIGISPLHYRRQTRVDPVEPLLF
ncbi:MAG: helix-turn-helix domain-containing protein [Eubacteriales bacterium]